MHHAPEVLKKEGHKLTPQRLMIWHILQAGRHLSAEDIHQEIEKKFPGIDLTTVYRTLELLVRLELVQESRFPVGPHQYEATDKLGHSHIICRKCGRVHHFDVADLLAAANRICENQDFSCADVELNISSVCNDCLKKDRS